MTRAPQDPTQPDLFAPAAVVALSTVRLAPMACSFGARSVYGTVHALGWSPPHHCFRCASCAGFTPAKKAKRAA